MKHPRMNDHDKPATTPAGEITFRDFILKIEEYLKEYWHFKWMVLAAGVLLMAGMAIRAAIKPTEYRAPLSFMIDEDPGNPLGAISGVLGTFGINAKGKNNPSKVLELSRSRRIVENTLFSRVVVNGQEDWLANHVIRYLDSLGDWNQKPWYSTSSANDPEQNLDGFLFTGGTDQLGTLREKTAIKKLVERIAGNVDSDTKGWLETSYDVESRIMKMAITTRHPEISVMLTNQLFDQLSRYYIETSVEKQQTTFDIIQSKTDSLDRLLKGKESQLAALEDSWLGSYSSQSKLRRQQLDKEIRMLNIALAESIKNLEIADFAVKNTLPYIQVIDRPVPPLAVVRASPVRQSLTGFILGIVLAVLAVSFRKMVRDALRVVETGVSD